MSTPEFIAARNLFIAVNIFWCTPVAQEHDSSQPQWKFEKTHEVVLDVGRLGQFDSTHAKYPSILKVKDEWWMWYNGRTDDRFTGSVGLAKSSDGLTWNKHNDGRPVFKHGATGSFDSTKVDHPSVLFFDNRYHMWYTAGNSKSRYTIGYASSPDGIQWKRENNSQPVLKPGSQGKFDDQVVLHPSVLRDPDRVLHMWYNGVGPQGSFRVGHATSHDGIEWHRHNEGNPVLEPGAVGDFKEGYVYNVFVFVRNGKFHMWYSAWTERDRTTGPDHNCITHAVSLDGNVWTKDPTPTLRNGPSGSLDEYACFACYVTEHDGGLWMYYSASPGKAGEKYYVSLAQCKLSVR